MQDATVEWFYPTAGASLESMAWLIAELKPVVNKEILAHLEGVQNFVRSKHSQELREARTKEET